MQSNNPKRRRTFTTEFKQQIVDLYRSGKRKYDITNSLLDTWLSQAENTGSFKDKDNRSAGDVELIKLRKENQQLKMENDNSRRQVYL